MCLNRTRREGVPPGLMRTQTQFQTSGAVRSDVPIILDGKCKDLCFLALNARDMSGYAVAASMNGR